MPRWEDMPESENVEDRREVEPVINVADDDPDQTAQPAFDRVQERAKLQADDRAMMRNYRRSVSPRYENGGAVEDDYSALEGPGDQQTQSFAGALKAVNEALMHGRQKYGLLGGRRQSFADGGAVEEEFPETADIHRQLLPEQGIPMDEEPAEPERGGQDNRFERAITENVVEPVQNMGRRIMGYLQAADADPRLAQQAEQEVDPEGILDENTRKLLAVEHARSRGGTDASWKLVQNYRKKYDGYNAFANAALQNRDLAGAARAASQAYPNMLDGSSITFEPAENGVIANITQQGGEPRQVPLTVQQFGAWLNNSQYDNVLAKGGPAMLEALIQQPSATANQAAGAPAAGGQRGAPAPRPFSMGSQLSRPTSGQRRPQEGALPPTDGNDIRPFASADLAQRFPDRYRPLPEGYRSPEVPRMSEDEERIQRQYPWASQGNERAAAMERHLDRGAKLEQRLAPAQVRADASLETTRLRTDAQNLRTQTWAGTWDRRTQANYDTAMRKLEQQARQGGDNARINQQRNAMRSIVETLRNGQPLSPQQQQVHDQIMNEAQGGAPVQQPAPRAPAPQQRQGQPAPGRTGAQRPPNAAFRDQQGRFYDKFGRPL